MKKFKTIAGKTYIYAASRWVYLFISFIILLFSLVFFLFSGVLISLFRNIGLIFLFVLWLLTIRQLFRNDPYMILDRAGLTITGFPQVFWSEMSLLLIRHYRIQGSSGEKLCVEIYALQKDLVWNRWQTLGITKNIYKLLSGKTDYLFQGDLYLSSDMFVKLVRQYSDIKIENKVEEEDPTFGSVKRYDI